LIDAFWPLHEKLQAEASNEIAGGTAGIGSIAR
jgi:hypothetical protein